MKLNSEQIIKALECCTRGRKSKDDRPCDDCPYNECNIVGGTSERQVKGTCQGWLMKDALALIKEQEKAIKELTEKNAVQVITAIELDKQVERLTEENENLNAQCRYYAEAYHSVKSDTVRKMHSLIKERCIAGGVYPAFVARTIEHIVKEMLEEG